MKYKPKSCCDVMQHNIEEGFLKIEKYKDQIDAVHGHNIDNAYRIVMRYCYSCGKKIKILYKKDTDKCNAWKPVRDKEAGNE